MKNIIGMHKEYNEVNQKIAQIRVENEQIKQMHEEHMARISEEGAKLLDKQQEKIHEQRLRFEQQFEQLGARFERLMDAQVEQRLNDRQEGVGVTQVLSR